MGSRITGTWSRFTCRFGGLPAKRNRRVGLIQPRSSSWSLGGGSRCQQSRVGNRPERGCVPTDEFGQVLFGNDMAASCTLEKEIWHAEGRQTGYKLAGLKRRDANVGRGHIAHVFPNEIRSPPLPPRPLPCATSLRNVRPFLKRMERINCVKIARTPTDSLQPFDVTGLLPKRFQWEAD
jgi:hypothetical protein